MHVNDYNAHFYYLVKLHNIEQSHKISYLLLVMVIIFNSGSHFSPQDLHSTGSSQYFPLHWGQKKPLLPNPCVPVLSRWL